MRIPLDIIPEIAELLRQRALRQPRKIRRSSGGSVIPGPAVGKITLAPKSSALTLLEQLSNASVQAQVVHLDLWYREKSTVGRTTFLAEVLPLINAAAEVANHLLIWGFPEHIARLVDLWPDHLKLGGWLTWYFNNSPSRGKSWRPAQQTCLHLMRKEAKVYPENFYSERHRVLAQQNRLEFKMAPLSVIHEPLLSGFIKRTEQTGYPAQKPVAVIERVLRMCTRPGDLIVDPTGGSGTTGVAAINLGCRAILCDRAAAAHKVMRARLAGHLTNDKRKPVVPLR